MITSVASGRSHSIVHRIALLQYGVAAVIAVVTGTVFFTAGRQPQMSPQEYLEHNIIGSSTVLAWLVPLLYVLLALSLVSWAGLRHSNRSRRGRALFVFTVGIVLILLASAFFLIRAIGARHLLGVGTAATLFGCAMVVVAAGSLLPTIEDWFGGRRELKLIEPILSELLSRQPDIGIGVRPRGPLVFQVAEKLSLISDALFLEAHLAKAGERDQSMTPEDYGADMLADAGCPPVTPVEQARAIAGWIYASRNGDRAAGDDRFPGLEWLRQPPSYSDREWIIEIARQYGALAERGEAST
jgi:hypothetical protein